MPLSDRGGWCGGGGIGLPLGDNGGPVRAGRAGEDGAAAEGADADVEGADADAAGAAGAPADGDSDAGGRGGAGRGGTGAGRVVATSPVVAAGRGGRSFPEEVTTRLGGVLATGAAVGAAVVAVGAVPPAGVDAGFAGVSGACVGSAFAAGSAATSEDASDVVFASEASAVVDLAADFVDFLVLFLSGSGCWGRIRFSRFAFRRTRSAWASSIEDE